MTLVINLFGGPGCGKSTAKAGLFFEMKHLGYKVEVTEEFAKELTYEGDFGTMENEMFLLAEQDRRQRRLLGKVDYIITDSPLLKSAFYVRGIYDSKAYLEHINTVFNSYYNYNVWVTRVCPYLTYGRSQTESEADDISKRIFSSIQYQLHALVPGDRMAPTLILEDMKKRGML
jgi:hypothetical protein